MALARAQILDTIATRAVAVVATSGRVFQGRGWAIDESELPAFTVVGADESVEPQTMHYPALMQHTLDVEVTAKARAVTDVDDVLHNLARDFLVAQFDTLAHASLSPLAGAKVFHTGTTVDLKTEGEAAIGQITVRLQIVYHTLQNAPEVLV